MRRVGTYLWRIVYVVTILLLGSNRWGDRSLYPDRWNHPVEIRVVSHGYHSGLVIPREALIRLSAARQSWPEGRISRQGRRTLRGLFDGSSSAGARRASTARCRPSTRSRCASRSAPCSGPERSVLHVVGLTGTTPRGISRHSDIVRLELSQDGFENSSRASARALPGPRTACRTNSAPGSTARACSTGRTAPSTSSTSATTGLPGSSPPPASRPRRFSRRIPRA